MSVKSGKSRTSAEEKLKQRNRELAILKAIAEELNRAVDVKSALENSLGLVAELLELKAGWVWLLDEQSGEPYLAAAQMLPPFLTAKPSRMQGKNCHCLTTFLAGDLTGAANINVLECSRLWGVMKDTNGLKYHASIPIYAHDKPLGVMNVASPDWRSLEDNDLQLLRIIGFQIGIAVERARLFDQNVRLAAAEERNRLAREIHDTIAQGLAATSLNLESAEVLLENPETSSQLKARQKLGKALNLTKANLDELRRWILDLRAGPFLSNPLPQALESLLDQFGPEAEVEIKLDLQTSTPQRRYPARIEMALYRIAQESLANVRKHARARVVQVTFQTETVEGRNQVRLIVHDDGVGFDPSRLERHNPGLDKSGGWGLVGMNERVRSLNGQLVVESCPHQGTRIEAIVPV